MALQTDRARCALRIADDSRRSVAWWLRRGRVSELQASDSWEQALSRRLRALIRTAPLHRIESSKTRRDGLGQNQDLRALCLRALDLVIEKMGLGEGASLEELQEGLMPLIVGTDPEATPEQAAELAQSVVLALLNEGERRRAFTEHYLDSELRPHRARQLQFHLLQERQSADGEVVVFATTEAINLYAGMLDYPVEDAQIAEEAVLQSQVARGRIADAVQTSRRARLRSIEYEQKIAAILETVRRDVAQVDWLSDVVHILDAAREHMGERIGVEREIRRTVEQHLDSVQDDRAFMLVELRDTLDECIERHARLHERLIGANRAYLDEQDRQLFHRRPAQRLPDLEADVFRSALAMPAGQLANACPGLLASFQAPRCPPTLRLGALVDRLLAPRRNERDEAVIPREAELERLPDPPRSFDPEDEAAVEQFLATTALPARLSQLLARARAMGMAQAGLRLLSVRVLRAFDPQSASDDQLLVQHAGHPLHFSGFSGDELDVDRLTNARRNSIPH